MVKQFRCSRLRKPHQVLLLSSPIVGLEAVFAKRLTKDHVGFHGRGEWAA